MKRSEMIKLMIEAYCDSATPQSSDDHERKMSRILVAMENAGMSPPGRRVDFDHHNPISVATWGPENE